MAKKPTRKTTAAPAERRSKKVPPPGYNYHTVVNVLDADLIAAKLADPEYKERVQKNIQHAVEQAATRVRRGCSEGDRFVGMTRAELDAECDRQQQYLDSLQGGPRMPSKEEAQADADERALDEFNSRMSTRLAEKRAAGYGGWDDPARCDTRQLAQQFMDKLFDSADLVDLANYAMMLYQRDGHYSLQCAVRDYKAKMSRDLDTTRKSLDQVRTQHDCVVAELRGRLARAEGNLARALGYIDRVTEGEPKVEISPMRETLVTTRGPQIDQGEHPNMVDFLDRR